MLTLFTMPDPASTTASVGLWSTPLFTDLLPAVYFVVGFIVAGMLISLLIRSIIRGVKKVTGGGRGGRGRRR